jgi:hypothetical protein
MAAERVDEERIRVGELKTRRPYFPGCMGRGELLGFLTLSLLILKLSLQTLITFSLWRPLLLMAHRLFTMRICLGRPERSLEDSP